MQMITDSWISNNIGCKILQHLFADAAMNVPDDYANRPWTYPGLNHGKAILTTNEQLNCYIHAYGRMHVYKIWMALKHLHLDDVSDGFEIIDWGCGQAIATLTLLAWLEKHCHEAATPRRVTLLDASHAALYRRAKGLVEQSLRGKEVEIRAVQTRLSGDTCLKNISRHSSPVVIHMLSNIIDVPGISIEAIAEAISTLPSNSYVVCTGHCATAMDATTFSQLLGIRGAQLLHRENVTEGAVLSNGKYFGWDITILQRDCGTMAA